jgi:hypothetical protein
MTNLKDNNNRLCDFDYLGTVEFVKYDHNYLRYYLLALKIFLNDFFQGMTFSYLTVVLSTIERRFGLKSKEAAW